MLTGATNEKGAIDINIRGMQGMDRVPVVVDGTRQSQTVYEGYAGVASRTYVDPDLIGGVTIEKGPSAAPDAVGATGGVARMSTINASDILSAGKNFGVRFRGGFAGNTATPPKVGTRGGIDQYLLNKNYQPAAVPTEWGAGNNFDRPGFFDSTSWNGSVAMAARNENIEVLAAYARRKQGNYFAGTRGDSGHVVLTPQTNGRIRAEQGGLSPIRAGEEVVSSSYDNTSLLLKGKLTLDGGHTLDMSYMKFDSQYVEMPWPGVTSLSGGLYENLPSQAKVGTWRIGYRFNPSENDLVDLKVNAWRTDTDFTQYFLLQQNTMQIGDTGLVTKSRRWGVDIDNTSAFSGALGDFKLRYGASYQREYFSQQSSLSQYIPVNVTQWGIIQSGNRSEASTFVSSEWRPYKWLKFDAALRYTGTKTEDDCAVGLTNCYDDTNEKGLAPIFAATVEPWDGFQIYARYAEAMRLPSLFESIRGSSFSASPLFNVKPEHAHNWEYGINVMRDSLLFSGDAARLKLAYFDNNMTNYITRRRGGTGEPTYVLTNLDQARFKGIEISAEYRHGGFFSTFGYTHYLKTYFCGFGTGRVHECGEAPNSNSFVGLHLPPRDSVSLTAGMRLFEDTLTVGGRVTYMGERVIEGKGGLTEAALWNPYTLVDLFATYKINKNLQVDVGIDNVADIYYVSPLSILERPGPGRTFRFNMTATF